MLECSQLHMRPHGFFFVSTCLMMETICSGYLEVIQPKFIVKFDEAIQRGI